MSEDKILKGLCKCQLCGASLVYISTLNPQLLCNGYKNRGECERLTVKEKYVLEIVEYYCKINKIEMVKSNEFLKSIIESVKIGRDDHYEIKYKDGHISSFNGHILKR